MSAMNTPTSAWMTGLPQLTTPAATLREPDAFDAEPLWRRLATDEVGRSMSAPPGTSDGFRRFFDWAWRERAVGGCLCYAIVPAGQREPVGLIQVRSLAPGFEMAEWGFAISKKYWGTGLFVEAASAVADFLFRHVGVQRLEARVASAGGRAAGALAKLGAEAEGVLRQAFERSSERSDQILWALNREVWFSRVAHPTTVVGPTETRGDVSAIVEPGKARRNWVESPGVVTGERCVLRSLIEEDAPLLASLLSAPAVIRFLAPPPNGVTGFRQFIRWTQQQREVGRSVVFGIVPAGMDRAVGFFQFHSMNHPLGVAEWGFLLGEPYWGTGLFPAAAALMLQFTFETLNVRRLEARAPLNNHRGNRALRKLGMTPECRLRRSSLVEDPSHDVVLWSLLADEWRTPSTRHVLIATSGPASLAS